MLHWILKALRIINVTLDTKGNKSWTFNKMNPLGWIALFIWAIIGAILVGLGETCRAWWYIWVNTLSD